MSGAATRSELDHARELVRDLAVIDLDGPPLAEWLGSRVYTLLETETTVTYGLARNDAGLGVEKFALYGLGAERGPTIRSGLDGYVRRASGAIGLYDPSDVSPNQRNTTHHLGSIRDLMDRQAPVAFGRLGRSRSYVERAVEAIQPLRWCFETWGVLDARNLRVLLCDGGRLVGYVGAAQHGAFSRGARDLFAALVGPMQRRFVLEERLGRAGPSAALVPALLEEITGAAYVLDGKRRIVVMNSEARLALEKDRTRSQRLARAVVRRADPDITVVDLAARGVPGHTLLIERSTRAPSVVSATAAARRFGLTRRELEVLMHLGRGLSNAAIAAALTCGVRTVETHVSRILAKTDCGSRSELVALVWSAGTR